MNRPLFVYGSLRPGLGHSLGRWLALRSRLLCPARYQGRLYDLGEYPGAVPSRHHEDIVYGELFLLRDPEAVLARLDAYEACMLKPPLFRRSLTRVTDDDGEAFEAWIYLYARPVAKARCIVSGDYALHHPRLGAEGPSIQSRYMKTPVSHAVPSPSMGEGLGRG